MTFKYLTLDLIFSPGLLRFSMLGLKLCVEKNEIVNLVIVTVIITDCIFIIFDNWLVLYYCICIYVYIMDVATSYNLVVPFVWM